MLNAAEIVRELSRSEIFRDYEQAFSRATHLPLALRTHDLWRHALEGDKYENPFCALMAKSSRSCAACLQVQQESIGGDTEKSETVAGQVALRRRTTAGFSKVARQLVDWGVKVDLNQLQDAYFHGKILSPEQYQAMVRLLEIFAKHLSEMAKALNVSTFYFCKMFKKATGLTFTDDLSRTRTERAKNLLLNPHVRVSEVVSDCGFISLTHFNRIFKRMVGKSPADYRRRAAKK